MDDPTTENQTTELMIGRFGWDYLHIGSLNRWSSNWFNAQVEIKSGAWSGEFTATFENGDLRSFASEIGRLYRDLSGTARLQQARLPYLAITCKGDGRGHIYMEGMAQERPPLGAKLTFHLTLDQTELPGIAAALEALDPPSPR